MKSLSQHFDLDSEKPVFSQRFKSEGIELSEEDQIATGAQGYVTVLSVLKFKEGANYFQIEILPPKEGISETLEPPAVRMGVMEFSQKLENDFAKVEPGRISFLAGKNTYSIDFPVGFSHHSYGYASVKGSSYSASEGKEYGEAYGPGDKIGCFLQNTRRSADTQGFVEFYKNGESQGIAYDEIHETAYSPAVSLYNGARVKLIKLERNREFLD